jgi:hypothetical protein
MLQMRSVDDARFIMINGRKYRYRIDKEQPTSGSASATSIIIAGSQAVRDISEDAEYRHYQDLPPPPDPRKVKEPPTGLERHLQRKTFKSIQMKHERKSR